MCGARTCGALLGAVAEDPIVAFSIDCALEANVARLVAVSQVAARGDAGYAGTRKTGLGPITESAVVALYIDRTAKRRLQSAEGPVVGPAVGPSKIPHAVKDQVFQGKIKDMVWSAQF